MKKELILSIALLGLGASGTTDAFAQSRLEHCNKVLEGDLFNKTISSKSSRDEKSKTTWATFLSTSESEAYDAYSRQYESSKKQNAGGELNIIVKAIPIGAKGGSDYDRKITESEFRELYNKMKSLNSSSTFFQSNSKTSQVSNLSILTRDSNSIDAWEKCVSQDEQPGLYAYGSRKESGKPFIKVVWAPGPFATVMPTVNVTFALPDGVEVKGVKENEVVPISNGGGKAFFLKVDEEEKAIEVYVNASVKNKFDDTYEAIVPPKEAPVVKLPDTTTTPPPTTANTEPKDGKLKVTQTFEEFRRAHPSFKRLGPAIGNKSTDSGGKFNPRGKIN